MADHIYIQCIGELMDGRAPYKVYKTNDWFRILLDDKDPELTLQDLNIYWEDDTRRWRWAIFPNTAPAAPLAEGDAVVLEDYEGH